MSGGDADGDGDDDTPLPRPLAHHVADPTHTAPGDDEFAPPTEADRQLPVHVADPESVPVRDSAESIDDDLTGPFELPRGKLPRAPTDLEDAPLFAGVPADSRKSILARFGRRMVASGVAVIRQGEVGHALIVVVRGRLLVRAERADGRIVTLGYVRDGEFIGEGSLLARAPSPITAIATETSELLSLSPKDAYDLAGAFPAVWAELKDSAERRTRDWDVQLAKKRT